MSEDMSDLIKKVSEMLNNKELPNNIQEMFNQASTNSNSTKKCSSVDDSYGNKKGSSSNVNNTNTSSDSNNSSSFDFSNIDINTILKMQQIVKAMNTEKTNSRANLLRSLKPYLKPSRQEKIEQYIQLFNMEKVIELLNNDGGGKK